MKRVLSIFAFIFLYSCSDDPESVHSYTQKNMGVIKTKASQAELIKTLTASIVSREKILLPPGSQLILTLENISRMGIQAEIVAKK